MPRIPRPPQPELVRLRKDLKSYLESNKITPTAIAKMCGLNQSTVQRFLAGDTKTVTPRIKPLLIYAGIDFVTRIDAEFQPAAEHPRIRKALEKVWDGEDETAEILASLIEAVGPVIQRTIHHGLR